MNKKRPHHLILTAFALAAILVLVPGAPLFSSPGRAGGGSDILLVLTGDIMPARRVAEKCEEHNDPYLPYYGIDNFTKQGDITFGNLETTVSTRGEPQPKLYHFRVKPEALTQIKKAGFDVLGLANNHISDYGPNATIDTMKHIEDYGMNYTGMWYHGEEAGEARIQRLVIKEVKGVTFAFLSFAEIPFSYFRASREKPGLVPTWSGWMKKDIEYAGSLADVVVVSIHWCYVPEYLKYATSDQYETCHKLTEYGADIIANHGPHVLQEIETYNGSLILHSLGNTVFDQSVKKTQKSAIALVHMKGTELKTLELVPLKKNDKHQYIPQGKILSVDIKPGLFLNWSDYNSRMFNSEAFITEYSGASSTLGEVLLTLPVLTFTLVTLCMVLLILLASLIIMTKRRAGGPKRSSGVKK